MKIQSCRALSAAVRVSIISALVATGATAQMPDPADPIPPDAVFSDTISATMAQGHPRVQSLAQTLEALKQADLDEIYSHYQDRFADASDFTFYFVGAFRLDEIKPMVEQYLGSLPNLGRVENWVDIGVDPPSGVSFGSDPARAEELSAVVFRDFRDIPSYDLIESWTAEQVQQAAIRYLRTDQYAKFVLLPEQKVP